MHLVLKNEVSLNIWDRYLTKIVKFQLIFNHVKFCVKKNVFLSQGADTQELVLDCFLWLKHFQQGVDREELVLDCLMWLKHFQQGVDNEELVLNCLLY